ncbi:hypothetical protein TWF506_001977 [Arthrobotrys conoides]|uniref:T6SS Phospholipase effector Tle1-like catalytic domain-containing protein n=1 Tax=Arthrobotrys conoides TaxID=74498 RepID=A0AAN8NNS2_9PEZI
MAASTYLSGPSNGLVDITKKVNKIKKRLIVCCDGTWFSADKGTINMPSNVARISRLISSEGEKTVINDKGEAETNLVTQIIYYQSGVGTGDVSFVDKRLQGGMGFGLDENVCTAYNFICNNYAEGDEILLFGFSRGAYTARALSGLVMDVGIIPPGEMTKFPEMYGEYKKRQDRQVFQLSDWFKKNGDIVLYQDVKISFVGVWDTVGALGIPESGISSMTGWNKGYQFWDTELHPNIEKAAHALALDEYRGPFTPTLWYHKHQGDHGWNARLIQCWFPGFHGHIGGGTVTGADVNLDETSVDDIALAWMVDQVGPRLTWDAVEIERFVLSYQQQKYVWAEGNLEDSASIAYYPSVMGGWKERTPGRYNHEKTEAEKKIKIRGVPMSEFWGTNEFIHPCVRYRMGLLDCKKPGDLGYTKGYFGKTPKKEYKPWALKTFELPTRQAKDDFYWEWRSRDEAKGDVVIREYQIPPTWAQNYRCLGLERRLVPPEIMKELDEGNNYGEAGPIQ